MRRTVILGALAALATSARAAEGPVAPWARRGQAVEARQAAHRARLQRTYEALRARVEKSAPDAVPTLASAAPKPVRIGYRILPRLVADVPRAPGRPAPQPRSYSWPWTEKMIEGDARRLHQLAAELDRLPALPGAKQRAACEKMVADYKKLSDGARNIDAHIQYNRFWQREIAGDRASYDRQTVLEHAVIEGQTIRDALASTDETTFRKSVARIGGIDSSRARDELERELRDREAAITREVQEETTAVTPPRFMHVDHPRDHAWILHVRVYTDIDDRQFVHAFKQAVEGVWRLRDGGDTLRVRLSIAYLPAALLYGERPVPHPGDPIDLGAHAALFPPGAVLTTGANTTHFTAGRCIALGPHDLAPHVLAHEFGHVLGFKDVYFRGYRDLGEDGFEVTEMVADPDDLMGDPGSGPVLRRHFEKLIGSGIPARSGP